MPTFGPGMLPLTALAVITAILLAAVVAVVGLRAATGEHPRAPKTVPVRVAGLRSRAMERNAEL